MNVHGPCNFVAMNRRSLDWERIESVPMEEARQQKAKPFGIEVRSPIRRTHISFGFKTLVHLYVAML
jgi:hypothetical protein